MAAAVAAVILGVVQLVQQNILNMQQPIATAVGLGLVGAILAAVTWHFRPSIFTCHELGVTRSDFLETQRLAYSDIESFTFESFQVFVNAAYAKTAFRLRFDPTSETDEKPILFTLTFQGVDDEMSLMRDLVSGVVGERMLAKLRSGRQVEWAAGYEFTPEGMLCPAGGVFQKIESAVVQYAALHSPMIDGATLSIWTGEEDVPAVSLMTNEPNFFPGAWVIDRLMTEQSLAFASAQDLK